MWQYRDTLRSEADYIRERELLLGIYVIPEAEEPATTEK
jgi:hypothetical protein